MGPREGPVTAAPRARSSRQRERRLPRRQRRGCACGVLRAQRPTHCARADGWALEVQRALNTSLYTSRCSAAERSHENARLRSRPRSDNSIPERFQDLLPRHLARQTSVPIAIVTSKIAEVSDLESDTQRHRANPCPGKGNLSDYGWVHAVSVSPRPSHKWALARGACRTLGFRSRLASSASGRPGFVRHLERMACSIRCTQSSASSRLLIGALLIFDRGPNRPRSGRTPLPSSCRN